MTDPLPSASSDIERMEGELQALRAELAARNSAFGERIEHQAATIEVLKAMSASPGDAQPVFDLIARQAAKLCNVPTAAVATFDGTMLHLATQSGFDAAYADAYVSQFPRPVGLDSAMGRAILNRRVEQVEDITIHPGHSFVDVLGHWSVMAVPISRDGVPLGAITIGRSAMGPFSDSQVALLQTFAEQAAIAIGSAETYRELQARTAALTQRNSEYGERIEQQSATIDVLKVMSASPGDARPVFELIVERARSFCGADHATTALLRDDMLHLEAYSGMSAVYGADYAAQFPRPVDMSTMFGRAILSRDVMQTGNLQADPDHFARQMHTVDFHSIVGVPLLREGTPIGAIALGRQAPGGFTDSQIALLQTFAEQAVIAITSAETYRALQTRTADLQESLEYQTATSDVLNVISRSTLDLQPVLDTVVETAARLCEAEMVMINRLDGDLFFAVANYGYPPELWAHWMGLGPVRLTPDMVTVGPRTLLEGRVVHIHDVAAIPGYPEEHINLGKQRTTLGVPLLREGKVIGNIGLARQRVEPFSDTQIALLQNFAAQAVIAIENTRLITEQREALEQQTATAEVLQVINASPGDLAPVFDAMLEKAMRLCSAAFGSLYTYDGERFHSAAQRGVPVAYSDLRETTPPTGQSGGPATRILQTKRTVHILDMSLEEAYQTGQIGVRALVDLGGARTVLGVPLLKDDGLMGYVSIYRQEVRPFTEKQIALLENFAAQAVIAMENARLLSEQREALEQQTATAEVLQVINASPGDLVPVFEIVLNRAMRLCGAQFGELHTFDGERFKAAALQGVPTALAESRMRNPVGVGRHSASHRMRDGVNVLHVADLMAEEAYRNGTPSRRALVDLGGARTALAVALRRDDVFLGVINIFRQEVRPFSDRQVALLESFAAQAVIAMENARLITEQREALEQQTATTEVLQAINASPGDLAPVFDAMLDKALRLCGAAFGALRTFDGEALHQVASRNLPPRYAEYWSRPVRLDPTNPVLGTAALEQRTIQIEDMAAAESYRAGSSIAVAGVELGGVRTLVHVPLTKDNITLGVLTVFRQEVKPFSDKELGLLQNFAAQAVIAMENARLISEQREALEQQTATAEVLQVINASPGCLTPVFEAMLEKASDLCNAAFGVLWTHDGERGHAVALRGVPAAFAEYLTRAPHPVDPGGVHSRLLDGEPMVHIADAAEDRAYRSGNPLRRALVELGGAHTMLAVPLRKDNAYLGHFVIYRREVRPFSDKQITLVQNFAAQAVIAMENARLLGELQERTAALATRNSEFGERIEQQSATIDVLKVMSSTPDDTQPVFDLIVRRAQELCNGMSASLYEFDGELVHQREWYGGDFNANEQFAAMFPMKLNRASIACRAILDKQTIHIRDAEAEPELLQAVRNIGGKTILSLPLLRDGVAIGAISLNAKDPGGFTDSQVALLRTFAEQAVIAITSVANFRALRERTAELTRSVAELQALEEVLRAVNSSLDLETVLATIISRAAQLSQADEGTIYEFNAAEKVFVPRSAYGMTEERVAALRERKIRLGETHLGRAALQRAPVHVPDVQQDPMIADAGGLLRGIHAVLAVPLLWDEKVVGGLVIRRRTVGGFAPSIPTLLQTFAGQAVLAIENAELFQEARRARTAAEVALADLRRAQDRLVQSEKMASLGQLTAGIAHEIKNPLNFVNNFSDLSVDLLNELNEMVAPDKLPVADVLRAEIDDITTTLKGNLEKIAEHGKRADSIVKNMLLHSRTGPSEHRPIDLNTTVEEALNLAYHGARAETPGFNITLEKQLDPTVGIVDLYPQEFIRVMLNLIDNGFYAAHNRANQTTDETFEPTLRLTTCNLGEQVEIRVRDNGTGISDAVRDKIFEPFFTTKPAGEGTGLGLSLSYDIVVKQHGGQVNVDSQADAFTEFVITLPRKMPVSNGGRT